MGMDQATHYNISLLEEIGLLTGSLYHSEIDEWARLLVAEHPLFPSLP